MNRHFQGTMIVRGILAVIAVTVTGLIYLSERGPGRGVVLGYVSQTESELRQAQSNLERFFVEHNQYPLSAPSFAIEEAELEKGGVRYRLTTPVAFLQSNWKDPFVDGKEKRSYRYYSSDGTWYVLASVGPDRDEDLHWGEIEKRIKNHGESSGAQTFVPPSSGDYRSFVYDSSNGLISSGDIVVVGP